MSDSNLLSFIECISGDKHLRVEEDYGQGFVKLKSAEAERRQAKHDVRFVEDIVIEMLRNSRDAQAHNIFVATTREGDVRAITILDDGCGIPPELKERVFEPRVTSKLDSVHFDDWGIHGRGMALFAIRSNASEACVMQSGTGLGSSFFVKVDLNDLNERADQSTFPQIEKDETGIQHVVRGPHNIIRTVAEFALAHRHDLNVYLGSPAEIAATLRYYGEKTLKDDVLLFCDDLHKLPVAQRLAACADASEFMATSAELGLNISERTAHRILNEQIIPLKSMMNILAPRKNSPKPDIYKDNRGLKLAAEDIEYLSRETERIFEKISDRYYLSLKSQPKVKVQKDAIRITLELEKEL